VDPRETVADSWDESKLSFSWNMVLLSEYLFAKQRYATSRPVQPLLLWRVLAVYEDEESQVCLD
jgi:hypothetical protein